MDSEFEQLDLGDARLNRRARTLMESMAATPTASVPKACHGWGETMAAYRFFDNASVEWRAILEPHWQQTEQRMAAQSVVLCLQDTTELDFNGQQARGLGSLSYEAQRGMYVHPTYAVTTASAAVRRKACAGSKAMNGWPSWRRACPPRALCMSPTARRTCCP
jgi:hypothetical protein